MPVVEGTKATLTDRSGTISNGGTSQEVMGANANRTYLLVQNVSAGDLWINFGVAAVANQSSIKLAPGAAFVMEDNAVEVRAVNVIGATTGQAYTAKEG